MFEYYLEIRWVHIAAVIASGSLFALRGLGLHLFNARWPMNVWLRYLSYTIDTVLLTAALMLMTIVSQYPFVDGWLTAKVLLLVVYIVLGSYGLKYGRTKPIRITCTIVALMVYGYIITVARARDPLGFLSTFFA